ncbi:hypothetical protein C8C82_1160 [Flavobacterium sp. 81]|nr:hypothetical protein C8C82_1160 [Flavobacterium sp. 81]
MEKTEATKKKKNWFKIFVEILLDIILMNK